MKKYIVQKHQSLVDIAIQLYGNVDALPELLELNPGIFGLEGECQIGAEVNPRYEIWYNDTSVLYNRLVVEERDGEILATVTENIVVLELPEPEYVFHPRTIDFFDGIADVPGGPWEDYFSMEEAIMLDRLVRDLNGEINDDYVTIDIWGKFIAMFPVMGTNDEIHSKNLFQPHLNMAYSGTGVTHGQNTIIMDGITGSGNTRVADGVDTDQANMSMGVVFSNYVHTGVVPGFPNAYMGAISAGKILFIRTFNGIYDACITTTSGSFGSVTAYKPDDFLHLQSNTSEQAMFLGGNNVKIAHKVYVTGTPSGIDITIGFDGATHGKADFNLAYIGESLAADERKSLMNSINYFMYQKSVRGSFTAIV